MLANRECEHANLETKEQNMLELRDRIKQQQVFAGESCTGEKKTPTKKHTRLLSCNNCNANILSNISLLVISHNWLKHKKDYSFMTVVIMRGPVSNALPNKILVEL